MNAYKVAVDGRYAYVLDDGVGGGALRVVDVADPAAPREVGVYAPVARDGLRVHDVAAGNGYAYTFSGSNASLDVLSVLDPATPRLVRAISHIAYTGKLLLDGARLLDISTWTYPVLALFDLSDPAAPAFRGSAFYSDSSGCQPSRPVAEGRYAYVTECVSRSGRIGPALVMVDLDALPPPGGSTAGEPIATLWFEAPDAPCPCTLAGGASHAYAAVGSTLRVVDVRDTRQPVEVAPVPLPGGAWQEARVVGDRLYAATAEGLTILSLADPARPSEVGRYPAASAHDVAVVGPRAYLAAGAAGLLVLDVADPARPRLVGALAQPPHRHTYLPLVPRRAAA